jgi:hypothetical protein
MRRAILTLLIIPSVLACGGDAVCIVQPCPFPIAVVVTVRAGTSPAAVPGAFVRVSNQEIPCTGGPFNPCIVSGYRGTYELDIGAPGFQTVHRTVQITGTDAVRCGPCPRVDTQQLDITLAPAV